MKIIVKKQKKYYMKIYYQKYEYNYNFNFVLFILVLKYMNLKKIMINTYYNDNI